MIDCLMCVVQQSLNLKIENQDEGALRWALAVRQAKTKDTIHFVHYLPLRFQYAPFSI